LNPEFLIEQKLDSSSTPLADTYVIRSIRGAESVKKPGEPSTIYKIGTQLNGADIAALKKDNYPVTVFLPDSYTIPSAP
jgi:hypothetical protein